MKTLRILALFLVAGGLNAQLTTEQKIADFRYLAGLYAKQYAPYGWKYTLFGFDALRIGPWLDRVAATTTDLDFYEVCVEYAASFNDTHVPYILPSSFVASLNIAVDIYDGKVLIEAINRARLPVAQYPFQIGDELVQVDGTEVEQLLTNFVKYAPQGNPRSARRQAAARIVTRPQSRMPHAVDLGDSADVLIRMQDGELRTFTIPWVKTGIPLHAGKVPSPRRNSAPGARSAMAFDPGVDVPDYLLPWIEAQRSASFDPNGVLNYGSRNPIYGPPPGFMLRLGQRPTDFFLSGSYTADGLRIGLIRIPNYGTLAPAVLQQFQDEVVWFEANTDGLVVDDMRNPGGFLCFGENIVAHLTPYPFRAIGYELRATWIRLISFHSALTTARQANAERWIIDLYESHLDALTQAYNENRGVTGPIPLCTPNLERLPATDRTGRMVAYTKPIVMLIDEFSTSAADFVPALLQDAGRATIFGWRTNGAGGTNTTSAAGAWSEAFAGVTLGLMTRNEVRSIAGYPASHYIENVGVHPDVEYDYMTRENLLQQGRPFVNAFTAEIVRKIRSER